jgi:hypothetical protein
MIPTTTPPPSSAPLPERRALAAIAWTHEERVHRMEVLGRRIAEHVGSMCEAGTPGGTSAEVRERAVAAFYEQLVVAERQLGRIREKHLLE